MGVLKKITDYLESINGAVHQQTNMCAHNADMITRMAAKLDKIQDELVSMNNFANDAVDEVLEILEGNGKMTAGITVTPLETAGGETMFLVSGSELSDLLTACRAAALDKREKVVKNASE